MVIEYRTDPDAITALLPPGFEPAREPDRACRAVRRLADRARTAARSCSTRPARSTASSSSSWARAWRARTSSHCPYIWVDQRLRADPRLDPGLPEEARLDLDDPAGAVRAGPGPRLEAGGRFGATCAADERRLARGHAHARGPVRDRAHRQRPAAPQRAPLPAHRRPGPAGAVGGRAREQHEPLDRRRSGRAGHARAVRHAARRPRRDRAHAGRARLLVPVRLHRRGATRSSRTLGGDA